MKQSLVILKSFQNGISVYLDPKADFDNLLEEVGERFAQSAGFFGNARMALSFEGRALSETEEIRIFERISQNCSLNITCIMGHDREKNQTYLRALQKVDALLGEGRVPPEMRDEYTGVLHKRNSEFFRESLRDNRRLEVPGNIIILGDVSGGSAVVAGGDIIVMGGLYGEAHCGMDQRPGHFIAALELSPDDISVCGIHLDDEGRGKWPIKARILPRIAFLEKGMVETAPLDREAWQRVLCLSDTD